MWIHWTIEAARQSVEIIMQGRQASSEALGTREYRYLNEKVENFFSFRKLFLDYVTLDLGQVNF